MRMIQPLVLPAAARAALDRVPDDPDWWRARVIDWCDRNTGSRNAAGLMDFLPLLEAAFGELPGVVARVPLAPEIVVGADGAPVETPLCPALSIRVRPEAPIQIALTGHYDTVFPAESAFQRVREIEPGRLNGPGVADMKGGLLVMLEALKAFETGPDAERLGYEVLISPDEEIGSPGSAPVLAALGARSDLGMTFEPALADGSMSGARKGSGNFALVIRGRAAHVGRAHHEGRSAIAAAARFAAGLEDLNGVRDGVTFNVGRIDGGGPTNVVPDLGIVRFNVRAPDPAAVDWARAAVTRLTRVLEEADGISTAIHGGFTRPAKPRGAGQALVFDHAARAGAMLGLSLAFKDTGGVCEGNNLAASGCANVDTLGPRGGLIHSDAEFALLDSYPERARLSAALLLAYACGALDAKAPRAAILAERARDGEGAA
jgi:glutamate carboxypeptidase